MKTELKGRYSPMETIIFNALVPPPKMGRQKWATSESLLRKVYPTKSEQPFNARIIINRALTTLRQKLQINREVFRLERKKRPRERAIDNRIVRVNQPRAADYVPTNRRDALNYAEFCLERFEPWDIRSTK